MRDNDSSQSEEHFDSMLDTFIVETPQKPTSLKRLPQRIQIKGKFYDLNLENKYIKYTYQVITLALSSEWYRSLSSFSQRQIISALKDFIKWFNIQQIDEENKFIILKKYETYRVNTKAVKPQSTGLNSILSLIKNGIHEIETEDSYEMYSYIDGLLTRTNISKYEQPLPDTLNNYFSSITWLREAIGDDDFLKLESPKRLINSFSITIATILLHIIHTKKTASILLQKFQIEARCDISKRSRNQYYCGTLVSNLCKFDENFVPKDAVTELLILDFVPKEKMNTLFHFLEKGYFSPKTNYSTYVKKREIFSRPNIFDPKAWNFPSELEQVLFAWLCARQTIQPSDIYKLKKNDFIITKNNEGRNVSVQCIYYKGRSARTQEPPMLDSRQLEGKAIIEYLKYFSDNSTNLISSDQILKIQVTFGRSSTTEKLAHIINHRPIYNEIISNLWKYRASPIFIKSYMALYDKREYAFSKWVNKRKKLDGKVSGFTRAKYNESNPFTLPILFFGLSAIKTTAVHSNSDRYRDGDLINQNSHTSSTEKISYLTDANKDWVNQHGRITRLVLQDIESYVYKPDLDSSRKEAYELSLRTKVIKTLNEGILNADNIKINSLGQVNFSKELFFEYEADADAILVLDTEETVVNMLHYQSQANSQQSQLILNALTFYEKTVLPTVEWMEYLLTSKLSTSIVKSGQRKYDEINGILPKLFVNEIRGSLGI